MRRINSRRRDPGGETPELLLAFCGLQNCERLKPVVPWKTPVVMIGRKRVVHQCLAFSWTALLTNLVGIDRGSAACRYWLICRISARSQ